MFSWGQKPGEVAKGRGKLSWMHDVRGLRWIVYEKRTGGSGERHIRATDRGKDPIGNIQK